MKAKGELHRMPSKQGPMLAGRRSFRLVVSPSFSPIKIHAHAPSLCSQLVTMFAIIRIPPDCFGSCVRVCVRVCYIAVLELPSQWR